MDLIRINADDWAVFFVKFIDVEYVLATENHIVVELIPVNYSEIIVGYERFEEVLTKALKLPV